MQVDLTVTISVILGLAAIVVPVIGQIISAIHDSYVRKIEIAEKRFTDFDLHRRAILENAVSALGGCVTKNDIDQLRDAGEALSLALSYLDDNTYKEALNVLSYVTNREKFKLSSLNAVIEGISTILRTIPKPH